MLRCLLKQCSSKHYSHHYYIRPHKLVEPDIELVLALEFLLALVLELESGFASGASMSVVFIYNRPEQYGIPLTVSEPFPNSMEYH